MSPLGTLLLPEPGVYPELFDLFAKPRNISFGISCSCSLLFDANKINPLVINTIQPLFTEYPGVWGSAPHGRWPLPLSPLESALTEIAPVTPLESALTKTPGGWGGRMANHCSQPDRHSC